MFKGFVLRVMNTFKSKDNIIIIIISEFSKVLFNIQLKKIKLKHVSYSPKSRKLSAVFWIRFEYEPLILIPFFATRNDLKYSALRSRFL